MSVVPNAGVAVTFATGGSTTTFELLVVVVGMVVEGDGVAVADPVLPVEAAMEGTETAVDPVALDAPVGETDPVAVATT